LYDSDKQINKQPILGGVRPRPELGRFYFNPRFRKAWLKAKTVSVFAFLFSRKKRRKKRQNLDTASRLISLDFITEIFVDEQERRIVG